MSRYEAKFSSRYGEEGEIKGEKADFFIGEHESTVLADNIEELFNQLNELLIDQGLQNIPVIITIKDLDGNAKNHFNYCVASKLLTTLADQEPIELDSIF